MNAQNERVSSRMLKKSSSAQTVVREARDMREKRDPKFEVQGSTFRKPPTSDLDPPSRSAILRGVPDLQTSETPRAYSVFPQPARAKRPDLLNFRLTQSLFFYSLYNLPFA